MIDWIYTYLPHLKSWDQSFMTASFKRSQWLRSRARLLGFWA